MIQYTSRKLCPEHTWRFKVSRPLALVVEDNVHIAQLVAMAARDAGYETEIVRNGKAALDRLSRILPDLIILDLHLPGVDGADILSWIRCQGRLAATRVIVVTGHWEKTDQTQGKADLVLLKPFSFLQLRDLASRLRPGAIEEGLVRHHGKPLRVNCVF
jgi:CheY-like chemotaxis protein